MAKKTFEKKIQRCGIGSAILLTKEILGENLEAPVGEVVKVVREADHIKIYPLKKSKKIIKKTAD